MDIKGGRVHDARSVKHYLQAEGGYCGTFRLQAR